MVGNSIAAFVVSRFVMYWFAVAFHGVRGFVGSSQLLVGVGFYDCAIVCWSCRVVISVFVGSSFGVRTSWFVVL